MAADQGQADAREELELLVKKLQLSGKKVEETAGDGKEKGAESGKDQAGSDGDVQAFLANEWKKKPPKKK
jgi:hypothetical protein